LKYINKKEKRKGFDILEYINKKRKKREKRFFFLRSNYYVLPLIFLLFFLSLILSLIVSNYNIWRKNLNFNHYNFSRIFFLINSISWQCFYPRDFIIEDAHHAPVFGIIEPVWQSNEYTPSINFRVKGLYLVSKSKKTYFWRI